MTNNSVCAVILAAENSTLPVSKKNSALGQVLFKPILQWILDAAEESGIRDLCLVTSGGCPELDALFARCSDPEVLQTNSLQAAQPFFSRFDAVLFLAGNAPFVDAASIRESYQMFRENKAPVCLCSACTGEQAQPSALWIPVSVLKEILPSPESDLAGIIKQLAAFGRTAVPYQSENPLLSLKADSQWALYQLGESARMQMIRRHMENGVEFTSLDGVLIGPDVTIGAGTVILPGTIIRGKSAVGENCTIGPNSLIEDSTIGNETLFNASQMYESSLGNQVKVGPFCHLRPGSRLEDRVKVGDFVEIKNSVIGEKTSLAHLTYIGDSDIGKGINFGGGCITCNYDGKAKYRTVVEDHAFIGCNTNLVAPVKVGEGAFIAAGSTITQDVEPYALAIARGRQVQKEDWAKAWFADKK